MLNLFDIVRLYETRQSGRSKLSPATIAEAQLIGRGARYCPFQLEEEQPKFQRKYDEDVSCELRVCEELYYHCQNDHRYVTELRAALRQIGLDADRVVQQEYVLRDSFRADELYRDGWIFLNDRKPKGGGDVCGLPSTVRDRVYRYQAATGAWGEDAVMEEDRDPAGAADGGKGAEARAVRREESLATSHLTIGEIASIQYAAVNKALMKYPVFRFSALKKRFPALSSTRQFITAPEYLGDVKLEIVSAQNDLVRQPAGNEEEIDRIDRERPPVKTLYCAVFEVLGKIARSLSGEQENYEGTREFRPHRICEIFKDKTVRYTDPHDGGAGVSQKEDSVPKEYRIDLSPGGLVRLYGSLRHFGGKGAGGLPAGVCRGAAKALRQGVSGEKRKGLPSVFLRDGGSDSSRISFSSSGRRRRTDMNRFRFSSSLREGQLVEQDGWKEEFLLQMKEKAVPVKPFMGDNDYRVWGMHFFNEETRGKEFEKELKNLLK